MKTRFAIRLLCCTTALAQQTSPSTPTNPASITQSITVTTTLEPLPLAESDRSINLISPRDQPLVSNSVVDYLRQDASLNLQARAPNGVQADLSLRGTTFEQSLILLNGLRINDPETGHLNLDIPIPLDAVTRIDILHGSGSTFYGSDAIGGAVNLLTQPPAPGLNIVASAGGGSYNSIEQHLRASYANGPLAEQLTASRDTSDGFIPDRNYSSNALASETWLTTRPGTTDILLATSDRPYGASQFYGPYPSWERTKGWFAAIQQQLGSQTAASFGYRRHTDLFVLFVDQPAIYENNHITTSYEGALRRADNFGPNTTLSYGVEADGDTINSNSLGQHSRNQGAAYANLSLRALRRFSLSLGARDEVLSGSSTEATSSPRASPPPTPSPAPRAFEPPPATASASPPTSTSTTPTPLPSAIPTSNPSPPGATKPASNGPPPTAASPSTPPPSASMKPTPSTTPKPSSPPQPSPSPNPGKPSTSQTSISPEPKPPSTSASPRISNSSSATPPPTPAHPHPTSSPSTPTTTPRRTPSFSGPASSTNSPRTPRSTSSRRPSTPPTRSGTSPFPATGATSAHTSAPSTSATPATRRSPTSPCKAAPSWPAPSSTGREPQSSSTSPVQPSQSR